ncbi:MAG: nucleotidyltransferase [Deltaproteobacteria bacterium]|nr:nucleotidyltransferase [Deltaproteobacteria bacterium]
MLNDHKVRFVVIGGVAVIAHGYTRTTEDIDIFIEPNRGNVEKTFAALRECGYDLTDTSVDEALAKKLLLRGYILKTDIHPFVTGARFDDVWNKRIEISFLGERVPFVSLDDLISMKKAAGRERDLIDLKHLQEIKRQTHQK